MADDYDVDFEVEKLREEKMELRKAIEASTPIEDVEAELQKLWKTMCDWDGLQPDSLVVRFSPTNPHRKEFDRVICTLT